MNGDIALYCLFSIMQDKVTFDVLLHPSMVCSGATRGLREYAKAMIYSNLMIFIHLRLNDENNNDS